MLVSFRWQQTSNMDFYLLELSQWPHGYSIPELHTPIAFFFVMSKLSPILGLSLPGPLLSPAIAKVVGYALANS